MKNFTARHSSGIVFLFGLGLFISLAMVVPMVFSLDETPPWIAVMVCNFCCYGYYSN